MRKFLPNWWGHSAPGAGVLAAVLVMLVAAIVLSLGCGHNRAEVLPVAVVAWPTNPKPQCDVLPMPNRLQIHAVDDPDKRTVFVTRRDWEDLAGYESALYDYLMSVQQCLAHVAPNVQEKP